LRPSELVGDALTVGGAVVDDGDRLGLHFLDRVAPERAAELSVVCDDAERGLEALLRVLRVGRRRRDLGDAGVLVQLGGRNRGARVQVADHAGDLCIDELLRGGGALLGIGRVVFRQQLELDFLTTDLQLLGVELLDRQLGAGLVVLAQVGDPCRSAAPTWPILTTVWADALPAADASAAATARLTSLRSHRESLLGIIGLGSEAVCSWTPGCAVRTTARMLAGFMQGRANETAMP
jgi:hypothetical protein